MLKMCVIQSKAIYTKKGNKMERSKQDDVTLSISMSLHPNKNSDNVKLDKI